MLSQDITESLLAVIVLQLFPSPYDLYCVGWTLSLTQSISVTVG